jgi:primosomal protein N' (replication factor Y) (superfamily II helicase)
MTDNNIAEILLSNIAPLDYIIPDDLHLNIGDFVIVPLRKQRLLGIVWKIKHESSFLQNKLRLVERKLPFTLKSNHIDFIKWVANYYISELGQIFKMVIPTEIKKNLIKEKPLKYISTDSESLKYTPPLFNSEQLNAISEIESLIKQRKNNITLYGVTGSGKTEIYLASIERLLERESQILILLPEISLTSQIIDRITKRFSYKPYIWHSNITLSQRHRVFLDIIDGKAKIIVGARSALFLPYKNLKMIIVDEEHEQSYKQEDGVTYQARDMAIMLASLNKIPIILASASPSLENIYNTNKGKFSLVTLSERYNSQAMPNIHIIDMKKEYRRNHFISPTLLQKLKNNLSQGKQSLLFINRKGYSPVMICNQCGYKICCKSCSNSLVYHKSQKKLKCHQCGYEAALLKTCPSCLALDSFITCGPGIEKLAEELHNNIPQARLVSITQENFSNHNKSELLLQSIANHQVDIILGTQIIAKGHHFPALTLVGIIDADSGLIGGDLRASEKTYQLLQQVGGRAGRELANSEVLIQTYNPHHPLIIALASYNRDKFIQEEMKTRELIDMPPFGRLACIIISSLNENKLIEFVTLLAKLAPISQNITLLGPAPAIIYKIRNKFRYRFLIKTKKNINIQSYINAWLAEIKIPNHINLKIDIDPYNFF